MTDFQEIYDMYFRDVYRYALSLCRDEALAEEVTQETFFKALENMDRFDGRSKISVWLCSIARNTYFSLCRKEKRLSGEIPAESFPADASPEQLLLTREEAFAVHRILHGMEEPYKEVFSLRTFGELSFRQIAQLFGKTESWARVTYHRARLKIKEELP